MCYNLLSISLYQRNQASGLTQTTSFIFHLSSLVCFYNSCVCGEVTSCLHFFFSINYNCKINSFQVLNVRHLNNMPGTTPLKVEEYQTLSWVPTLFKTSAATQEVITKMLEEIDQFHEHENATDIAPDKRPSVILSGKRRQQILGDNSITETTVATRVEVVPKSDNSKYVILSVLKVHRLFIYSKE